MLVWSKEEEEIGGKAGSKRQQTTPFPILIPSLRMKGLSMD